jgi:hypothetical protein
MNEGSDLLGLFNISKIYAGYGRAIRSDIERVISGAPLDIINQAGLQHTIEYLKLLEFYAEDQSVSNLIAFLEGYLFDEYSPYSERD